MWDNLRGFQPRNAYLPEMVWYGGGRGINATYELLKKKNRTQDCRNSAQKTLFNLSSHALS